MSACLLIANECYGINRPLREDAKGIQFRSIRSPTIVSGLDAYAKTRVSPVIPRPWSSSPRGLAEI